jgi:hypothetical protein
MVGGRGAGFITTMLVPASQTLRTFWLIRDVYVDPKHRRSAVARALQMPVAADQVRLQSLGWCRPRRNRSPHGTTYPGRRRRRRRAIEHGQYVCNDRSVQRTAQRLPLGSDRRQALVAQGIEQRFPKPCAAGSNPAGGTHLIKENPG